VICFSHINKDFPLEGTKGVVTNARDHCAAPYETLSKELENAVWPSPDPG
jgi:hypothetical protein